MEIIIIILLIILIVISGIILVKLNKPANTNDKDDEILQNITDLKNTTIQQSQSFKERNEDVLNLLKEKFNDNNDFTRKQDEIMQNKLDKISDKLSENLVNINNSVNKTLSETDKNLTNQFNQTKESLKDNLLKIDGNIKESLNNIILQNTNSSKELNNTIKDGLINLQKSNEEKLNQIQNNVNEKLDKSLNERLDSSFEKIGTQLSDLYKSLGELNSMQSGINNLNKTLTNVKTRGTWGEMQLQDIIAETMQPNQYERNVKTNKGSSEDLVEFVIKIPSKDDKGEVLLPIDSKFPTDMYLSIIDASEAGDKEQIERAKKNLENRIKEEARKIRDKYINPPLTTDFAVMFLPTESMYAEVLRINGLAEYCQNTYKIIISGPSTITALLNSLRIGFANLTLNKKTQEIKKVLEAVKTQYDKFGDDILKAQDRIDKASQSLDAVKKRSDMINSKMKNIDSISTDEAKEILGIEETEN